MPRMWLEMNWKWICNINQRVEVGKVRIQISNRSTGPETDQVLQQFPLLNLEDKVVVANHSPWILQRQNHKGKFAGNETDKENDSCGKGSSK